MVVLAAIVGAMLACFTALLLMRPVTATEPRPTAPSHYAVPAEPKHNEATAIPVNQVVVGGGW